MWLSDIRLEVLRSLRGGRLDPFQIAATIGEPEFRVRAELRQLKTDRLVVERIAPDGHTWRLTPRGEQIAWDADQLELKP